MNDMAKVFWTGNDQAVTLPEGYRVDFAELRISREGNRIVLEPAEAAVDPDTGLTIGSLRALVQEGLASGPSEPWNAAAIKREARSRRR